MTNCHLAAAGRGAGEQEIRDVPANDDQNQTDSGEEQHERLANIADNAFLERHEPDTPSVGIITGELFLQRGGQRVEASLRGSKGQPGPEPGDRGWDIAAVPRRMIRHRLAIETRGGEDLNIPLLRGSPRRIETRRHDADDPI